MDKRIFSWYAPGGLSLGNNMHLPEELIEVFRVSPESIQVIEEKPTQTVYLPFTRAEHDTIYFGNMPIDPMGIHQLEEYLKSTNIVLQLVKMTDQDATDFKGYFQWYIGYLNIKLYTPQMILQNTSGLWMEHLRRLGANV